MDEIAAIRETVTTREAAVLPRTMTSPEKAYYQGELRYQRSGGHQETVITREAGYQGVS